MFVLLYRDIIDEGLQLIPACDSPNEIRQVRG